MAWQSTSLRNVTCEDPDLPSSFVTDLLISRRIHPLRSLESHSFRRQGCHVSSLSANPLQVAYRHPP